MILASLAALTLAAAAPAEPVRVILVGDSTMQPRTGYGVQLCARFAPNVTCLNRARGGTSTKSYRAAGFWDEAMKIAADGAVKKTYVLIQLGTNDGSSLPARHTELPEYKANLAAFVDEARKAGATPVLITPLTDRVFKAGQLQANFAPWAGLAREVAHEKNAPLIDLFADSAAAVQKMGLREANTLAPAPLPEAGLAAEAAGNTWFAPRAPMPDPNAPKPATPPPPAAPGFDHVHLGAKGGVLFSGMVAEGLKRQVPDLAAYVADQPVAN